MMIINIIYIVILVFGILQIILFFKLWGMTNDVRAMKNKLEESSKEIEYYTREMNEHLRKIEEKHSPL